MRVTVLGCGASSGTPSLDFGWGSCDPANSRNRRLRPSILVESGETLRQNGLVELETVMDVTSRLIVHPASLKLRHQRIAALIEAVRAVTSATDARKATRT